MSRIRFAPLPDPHVCSVHEVEDTEAYDVPLDTESAKNPKLLFPFPIPGAGRKTSDASSSASSSMHSLTPTQSIDSTTPPSKKNRLLRFLRPRPDKENALTRWSSTSSVLSNATADSLFRTQSSNSFRGGNVRAPKKHPRRPSTAEGMLATLHTSRPQQRMLNGRVYGSKNLFASAPDKEPEFVEWGYGGMGSVRSQREFGGSVWGKVQSDLGAPDEDDGGGMAWVKRRKEERERKAREEEEKKRKEQEERKAQEEHDTRAVTLPMQDAPEEDNEEDEDADGGHHDDSPDDEDDDALAREASRTSRGAGVELVSRHHKS